MKFLLTSAGLRNNILKTALEDLVGKPAMEINVLVVTTAANTGRGDKRWLIDDLNRFDAYNFKSIDLIDFAGLPLPVYRPHFEHADVICFGGGDERYLARMMEEHNFQNFLPELLTSKVYMGISAGSMVVGSLLPVDLSKKLFIEEDFGDTTGEGLSLVPITFIPHIDSSYFSQIRIQNLEAFKDEFPEATYATDDDTALVVNGTDIQIIGEGVSWKK